MHGPIETVIFLVLQPFLSINFIMLLINPLKAPFHPACIAAIIFSLLSYSNKGTQSAVKTAIGSLFWFVIIASALIFFLIKFRFLLRYKNLPLCIWFTKKIFWAFLPIFLLTISKFLLTLFFLSFDPGPQFKLL